MRCESFERWQLGSNPFCQLVPLSHVVVSYCSDNLCSTPLCHQAAIPKQYLELRGQPIATYSMQTFAAMPQVGLSLEAPAAGQNMCCSSLWGACTPLMPACLSSCLPVPHHQRRCVRSWWCASPTGGERVPEGDGVYLLAFWSETDCQRMVLALKQLLAVSLKVQGCVPALL